MQIDGIVVHYRNGSHDDPDHTVATYLIDRHSRIRYDLSPSYPPESILKQIMRLTSSENSQ